MRALEILSEREAAQELRARLSAFPELFSDPPRLGLGAADASIRVVEFFDYKCGPCKAMHPVLADFVERHSDVRIEMRHLPILTPGSERAARFALAVAEAFGTSVYAQVNERLWTVRGPLNTASFEKIAEDQGIDFGAVEPLMHSEAITRRITYNRDLAIALDILGTPAFVSANSVSFGTTDIDTLSAGWLSQ